MSEQARPRTSILGVLREGQPLYYAMFALQQVMGTGLVAYYLHVSDETWLERVSTAILYQAAVSVASAGNSIGIIEVARGVIMLAKILEEKVLIPMQEKRREREARAREEAQARREEAQRESLDRAKEEGRQQARAESREVMRVWVESLRAEGHLIPDPPALDDEEDQQAEGRPSC